MTLRRLLSVPLLLVTLGLVLSACAGRHAVDQSAGGQFHFVTGSGPGTTYSVADRKPAGGFTGNLLDGGTLSLSQDRGKVVVINFWATWCSPCIVETPQFDSLYRKIHKEGVDFIGVDTKDIRGKAQAFVKDNKISYPIIYDEQGETALRLGNIPALGLPFTVLIDKQQRVAAVYLQRLSPADLEPVINKLVAEA